MENIEKVVGETSPGDGDAQENALVNLLGHGNQGEPEEDFDFDPLEGVQKGARKWFAMARYFSAFRSKGLFDEMGVAWKLAKPIQVTDLEDNRFIQEFDREDKYIYLRDE
jgi:hypothetical protein